LGPYKIEKCYDNDLVKIRTIDEEGIPLLVNGFKAQYLQKTSIQGRIYNHYKITTLGCG
jgi:hypothetical protein